MFYSNSAKTVNKKVVKPVPPLKNRRTVKVQKYTELNTDEESISSKDTAEMIKRIPVTTRRSFVKEKKPENRKLRSTRSLVDKLPTPKKNLAKCSDTQSNGSLSEATKVAKSSEPTITAKTNKDTAIAKDSSKETPKEKAVPAKRKRDTVQVPKEKVQVPKEKDVAATKPSKPEAAKSKANEPVEEDSTVQLQKSKKKKENDKDEPSPLAKPKPMIVESLKTQEPAKTSDDEESFRGFAKRPLILEDCKANVLKSSGGSYPCIKSDAVKLEPDFGELKV